jgi:hypothetical protein
MRMIRLALFVFMFTAPLAIAQATATPAVGTATSVTVTWTPPAAVNGLTITGYTTTITGPTGGIATVTTTGATANNAVWTAPGPLYYGIWTAAVVTNATNSAGTAKTSAAVTGTATYSATPVVTTVPPVSGVGVKINLP